MSEVVKYDANVVMQGVKDKIRATFVDLIPEEKWNEMIQTEIDVFLRKRDSYSDSPFTQIVKEEMRSVLKEKMQKLLRDEYSSTIWENNTIKPSKAVEKIIIENSGAILLSVIGGMIQSTISNSQYR